MKVIKGNIILWPITNRDVLPTMLMITPTSLSMMPIIYPWSLCLFHSPMSLLWKMFCLCHHAYHKTCHTACLRKPHTCRNRQNMLHVGLWPLICLICFLLILDRWHYRYTRFGLSETRTGGHALRDSDRSQIGDQLAGQANVTRCARGLWLTVEEEGIHWWFGGMRCLIYM